MISDVLSDAAVEIRRWLEECPHIYGDHEDGINDLLTRMDKLRGKLDSAPPEGPA